MQYMGRHYPEVFLYFNYAMELLRNEQNGIDENNGSKYKH